MLGDAVPERFNPPSHLLLTLITVVARKETAEKQQRTAPFLPLFSAPQSNHFMKLENQQQKSCGIFQMASTKVLHSCLSPHIYYWWRWKPCLLCCQCRVEVGDKIALLKSAIFCQLSHRIGTFQCCCSEEELVLQAKISCIHPPIHSIYHLFLHSKLGC